MAPMFVFPHRPQLLEIVPKRFVEFSFSFTREFFVVTGRSHRGRQSFASDAEFKRFFNGQIVGQILQLAVAFSPDDFLRIDAAFLHVK